MQEPFSHAPGLLCSTGHYGQYLSCEQDCSFECENHFLESPIALCKSFHQSILLIAREAHRVKTYAGSSPVNARINQVTLFC